MDFHQLEAIIRDHLQVVRTVLIADGIVGLHLILDEAVSQVDEVDDDEVEVVGKKI